MAKKILYILLSFFVGAFYVFSAYTKLQPIESFEYSFVDIGISNWYLSPFFARTVIGFEFFIGLLFILNYKVKTLSSKLSLGLLVFFTIYLFFILIKDGNTGNCGCFGEFLPMTPLDSILKNVGLILISFLLLRQGIDVDYKRVSRFIPIIGFIAALAFPYIKNPVDLDYSESYLVKKENNYFIPLDTLIVNAKINKVPESIKLGKHVIIFLSSTCPHCKVAAGKIRIMKEKNPNLPFYLVINGKENNIETFRKNARIEDIPWTRLTQKPFVYLTGFELPAILLVNNQIVEGELNYFVLDQKEIENWLGK